MKTVEMFLNILHYIAYKAQVKVMHIFYKYTGLKKLMQSSLYKKRMQKFGIENGYAYEYVTDYLSNREWGITTRYCIAIVYGILLCIGLGTFFLLPKITHINYNIPLNYELFLPILMPLFLVFWFIWRSDKYLEYFKEFDKRSRQWKLKWGWITLGIPVLLNL